MTHDLIDDLIHALNRVVIPDKSQLKEILILSGMPGKTENLRYLGFNRQVTAASNRRIEFSAVAVINNHRADRWRIDGYRQKISRLVFHSRWTRNPLDIFINNLRCTPEMMRLLAASSGIYTLLGILRQEEVQTSGMLKRRVHYVRPVLVVSGIDEVGLRTVVDFETANEIKKTRIKGLPFYRKLT